MAQVTTVAVVETIMIMVAVVHLIMVIHKLHQVLHMQVRETDQQDKDQVVQCQ